jgi:hypothetical protein
MSKQGEIIDGTKAESNAALSGLKTGNIGDLEEDIVGIFWESLMPQMEKQAGITGNLVDLVVELDARLDQLEQHGEAR